MSAERYTNAVLAKTMQKERHTMKIELFIDEEQEIKLNCIIDSQGEPGSVQELAQRLFNEALTANYVYFGKCEEEYSRQIPDEGEEVTTAYYDSEENNELLLYDPLDPNVELDEDGYRI